MSCSTRCWPGLRAPAAMAQRLLVGADIRARTGGEWHAAEASLQLLPQPGEDIGLLGDVTAQAASAGWLGIPVARALDA